MESPQFGQRSGEGLGANPKPPHTHSPQSTDARQRRRDSPLLASIGRSYASTSISDEATVVNGDNYGTVVTHRHHFEALSQEFTVLHRSLAFDRIHARFHNVARALPDTCRWLYHHAQFVAWKQNGGFLWIKGKPGSGKSTIMKELHDGAKTKWQERCVLSYFFNARSPNVIEKSPLGLYRSLLHQLLAISELGHKMFLLTFKDKVSIQYQASGRRELVADEWAETELQNFLLEYFRKAGFPATAIFIDALDEGQENEVRSMIGFLQRLTREVASTGQKVWICLSSRHYPNFTVRTPHEIVLEDQRGQREDIETYISIELLTDDDDAQAYHILRNTIRDRSEGIFLWVVLVVQILNTLYDQGKGIEAMTQKLVGIPKDLRKLFTEILSRDAEDIEESVTLFRWVLFSEEPMSPQALCTVIHHVHHNGAESSVDLYKYLLNCSRGLTAVTKSSPPVIQFIHETVRNYFLNPSLSSSDLARSISGVLTEALEPATSHMVLAENCLDFFLHACSLGAAFVPNELAWYTARAWWLHYQKSRAVCSEELSRLAVRLIGTPPALKIWMDCNRESFSRLPDRKCPALHCASMLGIPAVISAALPTAENMDGTDYYAGTALSVAARYGYETTVQILLAAGANVYRKGRMYGTTPLEAAAANGHETIARLLLEHMTGADSGKKFGDALNCASYVGHKGIVRALLKYGADPNVVSLENTALHTASERGFPEIVQILLDGGADPNYEPSGRSTLLTALQSKRPDVVSILLRYKATLTPQEEITYDMKRLLEACHTYR